MKAAQPTYDRFKVTLDFRTLNEYFARLEKNRPAINVGTFVGAGGLRAYVLGSGQKAATAADLDAMKKLVEQAMQQGALGLLACHQVHIAGIGGQGDLGGDRRERGMPVGIDQPRHQHSAATVDDPDARPG